MYRAHCAVIFAIAQLSCFANLLSIIMFVRVLCQGERYRMIKLNIRRSCSTSDRQWSVESSCVHRTTKSSYSHFAWVYYDKLCFSHMKSVELEKNDDGHKQWRPHMTSTLIMAVMDLAIIVYLMALIYMCCGRHGLWPSWYRLVESL